MKSPQKFHIVTFGCQQNLADSERIVALYQSRGFMQTENSKQADLIVINTCMIRESAENRVYGLINNLAKERQSGRRFKIILTGCLVGMAVRDRSGRILKRLRKMLPDIDEFLPIEEVGFDLPPVRADKDLALIPITNGCNNFCTYCVVPFTRGREISRPFEEIIDEAKGVVSQGYRRILLLGQNVNSYGSDLLRSEKQSCQGSYGSDPAYFSSDRSSVKIGARKVKPVYVKHLGKLRIPTLFPELLKTVAEIPGLAEVDFISSNPWDFSDQLIAVIAGSLTITRRIHLPVQSGDNEILAKMNRWYTSEEYIRLTEKIRQQIPGVSFSTDIIVGFPGESEKAYENTKKLVEKIGFTRAFISVYSARKGTASQSAFADDVPYRVKRRRWQELDTLINGYAHEK